MKYIMNTDVHRWKKGQVVSEEELVSEGIQPGKWLETKFILMIGDSNVQDAKKIIQEKEEVKGDLNNDGVVDSKDGSIASNTLNILKKKRGR